MRILIADDSALIRSQLEDVLAPAGFELIITKNGLEAWQVLEKGSVRLAVLDWLMPGMDGVELCRRISTHPSLQAVYAILLTSRNRPEEIATAFEAGASDYVTKPFVPLELLARVRAGARFVELQTRLAQAHKLESIGQLASGIAHEINTPIQYIGDNTRFLQSSWNDITRLLAAYRELVEVSASAAAASEAVQKIHTLSREIDLDFLQHEVPPALSQSLDGVDRVTQIVRAMKDFAHPGTPDKRLTDIHQLIHNTITVARNEWKYVADVTTEFAPEMPQVSCLPGEIGQVLLNIIVNAAQAIAELKAGKGLITLRTVVLDEWAEIQISDTGCGIPEEFQHRVFDPFFTSKEVGKGTGQGLTIARSIVVEKHQGELTFASLAGQGTTFFIRLPLPVISPVHGIPAHDETPCVCG